MKAADFSLSPIYHAAWSSIEPGKGISLRFPRFIRVRTDKSVQDATSAEQITHLYSQQQQIISTQKEQDEEDDYY